MPLIFQDSNLGVMQILLKYRPDLQTGKRIQNYWLLRKNFSNIRELMMCLFHRSRLQLRQITFQFRITTKMMFIQRSLG